MKSACMIISAWFGPRRPDFNSPTTPKDQKSFFESVFMEHARRVDPGVNMDLVIVNNIGAPIQPDPRDWRRELSGEYNREIIDKLTPSEHEGNEYIAGLDGAKINRGKVRVFRRWNSDGKGFDGFAYGFMKTQNDYDYFLFCEDDVVFFLDDYFKEGIETFESNKDKIACVGYSLISPTHAKPHFAGGLLMSSKENLIKVSNTWPESVRLIESIKNRKKKYGAVDESSLHPVHLWDLVVKNIDTSTENSRLPDNEYDFTDAFNFVLPEFREMSKKTDGAWPIMYPNSLSPFARNWKDLSFQADTLTKVEKLLEAWKVDKKWPDRRFSREQRIGMETMIEKVKAPKCFFVGNEKEDNK